MTEGAGNTRKEYCKDCGGVMKILPSIEGDPEGIRHDRLCLECGQVWGCSKAHFFRIR